MAVNLNNSQGYGKPKLPGKPHFSFFIPSSTTVHLNWTSLNWQYWSQCVLVVCMLFQMVETFPFCKADALTVAKKLLESMFATKDIPSTSSSDGGAHFTEQIIQALRKALHLQTSWNYHWPECSQLSSKVERTNGKTWFERNSFNYETE